MKESAKKQEEKNEFDIFREQVEKELRKLSREEVVRFAWRCAVRALPFLGAKGNLDFWKEEERHKYLQSLFYALDLTAFYADHFASDKNYDTNSTKIIPNIAQIIKVNIAAAAKAAQVPIKYAVNADNSPYHIYTALSVSYTVQVVHVSGPIINLVVDAATTSAKAALSASAIFHYLTFLQMTSKELKKDVDAGEWANLYNLVWPNFKNVLEENGCEYWGNWYQKIFEKGFVLDNEDQVEIAMRLDVPDEIRDQGAATVGRYMEQLKAGAERLNEARILILGDKGAGKTCLARRLKDPSAEMTKEEESTPGVDTSVWKLEKENVNIHIWDFAGHTVTHAVHQFFLSERCLYINVFDGRTDGNNRWEYWLDHMKNYGKESKAIILVNRRDAHAVEVPINKLKEQYPILDVCTFSIRDDKEDLEKFRQKVANYIATNPSWSNLLIPESSYKVKKELENLFNNGDLNRQELIERKDFDAIAEKCKVEKEKIEGLLSDLHALGISLWYKDMEKYNTMVLNPEWISNGVYRIINWTNNQRKHCLEIGEFSQVFEEDSNRYPEDKHRFLFELMKKYELAYEAKEKDMLIIPRLLHEDQPANMPQFHVDESLMARYKADQPLMPDTISRFIVRHNEEIKKVGKNNYLVWRSGIILEQTKGTIALVRETDDRTIAISVKGPNKTEYLSKLRETLNTIFEGYKSKKPELQYSVERYGEIYETPQPTKPLWLSDNKIFTHTHYNIPYFDEDTRQQIILNQTVVNYNITAQTLINGYNISWDQSVHETTINIQNFQGNIEMLKEDVARELKIKKVPKEEIELLTSDIEVVETSMKEIETAQQKNLPLPDKSKSRLKQFFDDLSNENSNLYKKLKLIRKGRDYAVNLAELYNKIAANTGLLLVPPLALEVIKKI
jgi:small GTP-binding protein